MSSTQEANQQPYSSTTGDVCMAAHVASDVTVSPATDHGNVEMLDQSDPITLANSDCSSLPNQKDLEAGIVDTESSINATSPTVSEEVTRKAQHIAWTPSILRAGPLFGIAALVLAFVLMIVSYAILKASDGDQVPHWRY